MKLRILPFALFAILSFTPLFLGYMLYLLLLMLNIDIGLRNEQSMMDSLSTSNIVLALGIPAFLLVTSSMTYYVTTKLSSWLAKGVMVLAAWQLLGFPLAYLFSAALAGVSMAVVEGAASMPTLWLKELQAAIEIMFAMQFCALPWTIAAITLMVRFLSNQIWPTPRAESKNVQAA